MTNEEYQKATAFFAIYPEERAMYYVTLGLASEAGEVAGKVAKWERGDTTVEEAATAIDAEMGDCLWMISQWCNHRGITLGTLMQENITKLEGRADRGTLRGNGDSR